MNLKIRGGVGARVTRRFFTRVWPPPSEPRNPAVPAARGRIVAPTVVAEPPLPENPPGLLPARLIGRDSQGAPLRPDPEKMQRVFRTEELIRPDDPLLDVETLKATAKSELDRWRPPRPDTPEYEELERLAVTIRPDQPEAIIRAFLSALKETGPARPLRWRRRDQALEPDWFLEPWYVVDARNFWTQPDHQPGGFDAIAEGLTHIAPLGFSNILVCNHYETEFVSGSHGVALHVPAQDLGGAAAFVRMIDAADALGLRIATSAAFHRTSVLHPWFTEAGRPHTPQVEYYQEASKSAEGVSAAMHPALSRAEDRFRSSAPGLVELDLSCPRLLREVLVVLGDELDVGVLRARSVDLRYSTPGRVGHAVRALFKLYMRSLGGRSVLMIHSTHGCAKAPSLVGPDVPYGAERGAEQGDLIYGTELSIALRETLYTADRAPLEAWVRRLPTLPDSSRLIAFIEDERSVLLSLTSNPNRWRRVVSEHHGVVSPNGQRVAVRHGDAIEGDDDHVALSLFLLYMLPATPLVQYGTEIGAGSAFEDHERQEARRLSFLRARRRSEERDVFYEEPPLLSPPLGAEEHAHGLHEGRSAVRLLTRLNWMRRRDRALRSRMVTLLDLRTPCVLAWLKGHGEDARLFVANLSSSPQRVQLPGDRLPARVLECFERGRGSLRVRTHLVPKGLQVVLGPHGFVMA